MNNCPNCGNSEHGDLVLKITNSLPNENNLTKLSNFYKIMGDSTRLKILMSLENDKLCVTDLACILNMSLSAISHQLKVLRDAKLVKNTKIGKTVYYELDDEHINHILDTGLEHIIEK